ncbi:PREDICTED: odorant receptor 4-like [Dinoponera quadriceps]|uniref:Odorant receptor 4-like n=1 Tax=Dinoponera quadriceps TaxID=609295 RepID=A0A6P3XNI2_DINQU|nr:PREDICTED: odorant receptor 4-like [Dinoponera quadriceps]
MWEIVLWNWKHSSVFASEDDTIGKRYILHFVPNFIVAFNSMSVTMTSYNTLKTGIHFDEDSNATRPYILLSNFPFDNNKQVYIFIIFLQFFYVLILFSAATTINSVLLVILIMHLGHQIDVICECLMKMSSEENMRKTNVTMMKETIRQHQSVITFSENIEYLYTYIALILVLFSSIISCGLSFVLVVSIASPHFSKIVKKNIMFFGVVTIESFIFCFAGEYLSSKSREIGEPAYSSPWYQSKFHGHAVLFMIMKWQNQLTITMGKFACLSLELFSSIITTSGSYVSVLLAMY